MAPSTCPGCGTLLFAAVEACTRCGAQLAVAPAAEAPAGPRWSFGPPATVPTDGEVTPAVPAPWPAPPPPSTPAPPSVPTPWSSTWPPAPAPWQQPPTGPVGRSGVAVLATTLVAALIVGAAGVALALRQSSTSSSTASSRQGGAPQSAAQAAAGKGGFSTPASIAGVPLASDPTLTGVASDLQQLMNTGGFDGVVAYYGPSPAGQLIYAGALRPRTGSVADSAGIFLSSMRRGMQISGATLETAQRTVAISGVPYECSTGTMQTITMALCTWQDASDLGFAAVLSRTADPGILSRAAVDADAARRGMTSGS